VRTIFQQVIVGTTALAIAAILLVVEGRPSDKILTALGVVFLGAAIYVLAPTIWSAARPRRREVLLALSLALTAVLIALRLLFPVQLAPRSGSTWLEPTLKDRLVLTLGVWKDPYFEAPPDWGTTGLHVVVIAIGGVVLSRRLSGAFTTS
jgi:hypothetical protein